MTVTCNDFGMMLAEIFQIEPDVEDGVITLIKDDAAAATLMCFTLHGTELCDIHKNDYIGVRIALWFMDIEGVFANLISQPTEMINQFRKKLQQQLNWGTLEFVDADEGDATCVCLERYIEVHPDDFDQAAGGDPESVFFHTLNELISEWRMLSPIIFDFQKGTSDVHDDSLLGLYLAETDRLPHC